MEKAEKLIHDGNNYLNELEFKEALKCFNGAVKLDPSLHQAYFGRAEASLGVQSIDSKEIAKDYERAIALNENEPLYYVRYGGFCIDEMLFKKAEECYNKAAEIDDANSRHYYSEFANEYVFMENVRKELKGSRKKRIYTKALRYLLKGIYLAPEDAHEYLNVMLQEGEAGEDEEEEEPEE